MSINADAKSYIEFIINNDEVLMEINDILTQSNGKTLEDTREFLLYGTQNGSDSIGGQLFGADMAGLRALNYDESDPYSEWAIDYHLSVWVNNGAYFSHYSETYSNYTQVVKDKIGFAIEYFLNVDPSSPDIRSDFWAEQYGFTTDDKSLITFASLAYDRINIWSEYLFENGSLNFDEISNLETNIVNESTVINAPSSNSNSLDTSGYDNLLQIGNRIYQSYELAGNRNSAQKFFEMASIGRPDSVSADAFYRVFSKVSADVLDTSETGINSSVLLSFINKLQLIGVFQLAGFAEEISQFTRRRAASIASVQQSAYEFINPAVDQIWIDKLLEVEFNLRKDPILFYNVLQYFPSLAMFILDALTITADYSNGGEGGGEEDILNNPEAFLDSLAMAFGMENGKAIFTLANRFNNTAKRMKDVIEKSPYRSNTPPESPDIFHLRLGAANFYVPPVTIDINSQFKAGSLMGSAIRQKNSPKFNSGYKETSIRMRLFFPNYEEIWGITIKDGSTITLNEDFKIDFRSNGDSDEKIDKFLSSLRGLVAAFKYSPFLPIKNHYLNVVHGINAVGLSGMTIATIPNFPFALAVDLELVNFNHKPFLPMLTDFNQAIHWGKYRQYMGKAAGQLSRYVNEEFLIKTTDVKEIDSFASEDSVLESNILTGGTAEPGTIVINEAGEYRPVEALSPGELYTAPDTTATERSGDVLKTNILSDWRNGNHLTLFVPAEAQTKLYLPSVSSFRTEEEEKVMTDLGESFWDSLLRKVGVDINQSASYGLSLSETTDISRENTYSKSMKNTLLDLIQIWNAGSNPSSQQDSIYEFLTTTFISQNGNAFPNTEEGNTKREWFKTRNVEPYNDSYTDKQSYIFQNQYINASLYAIKNNFEATANNPNAMLDFLVEVRRDEIQGRTGQIPDEVKVKQEVSRAFNVVMYENFYRSGPVQAMMEASRLKSGHILFNEWEVPMLRVDLDPDSVIINGVTVSLGNNLVKLQVQMQDEPTYQHIGGRDSYINISMTVIGERELIKFKKIFDHISSLARLEHSTGVIGFLGIKNIITALAGIKYVMPLNYTVNTRPNFPHVYDVELSLVDFDIFQQKREELSSRQQRDLVDHFGTKRNPFLRIKQLWGSFNAYPDFPLSVVNDQGETVGHLDPDFYFRSFEMFDKDVINNLSTQVPRIQDFAFEDPINTGDIGFVATVTEKILGFIRQYNTNASGVDSQDAKTQLLEEIVSWMEENQINKQRFINIFYSIVKSSTTEFTSEVKYQLLTDFISFDSGVNENNPYAMQELQGSQFQVGDYSPNSVSMLSSITAALEGEYSLSYYDSDFGGYKKEEYVSFHPDEVDFHKQIFSIPASDKKIIDSGKIPSILHTALGVHYGYIDKNNGRFYLTIAGNNVRVTDDKVKFGSNYVRDTQTPDQGTSNTLTGVAGVSALSDYQKPTNGGDPAHWETMMVDTQYRDVSGRMIRAFPTYMLWLIDEGGYFAGAKLFDNFYGLQSIIDFSVVSSEDLLGDTLIFRVSNLYSKLTTKPSTELFASADPNYDNGPLNLSQGLSGILDRSLNIARNIASGMRNDYVVDIMNIRLKPGVRVHLRGGYGANPNALQTLFNGIITNVEQGEIVTVTAQSDAIELGAIVNSTDQKGSSGKIDGGVDTGMYLSEPRDLMVRLLSMGSSRVREAFAHSTRGTVFSQNKFGIRHFGTILYEPLTESEALKSDGIRESITAAIGYNSKANEVGGFSFNLRGSMIPLMSQLWANFSAQTDLEIFKRNIYPGNGLGIAQFLGGDIDDGWSTVSAIDDTAPANDRTSGYLGRLSDQSYNQLLINYQNEDKSAKEAVEFMTAGNRLNDSSSGFMNFATKGIIGGALTAGITALAGPVAGTVTGAGLLGVLSGRGGTNLFRTMGILSPNPDDDLAGFDEVSFRAQTYMRTVWDLFQTCAKLLPNYIVAVRPFEDRSTVFYGKPHWLYTSGVVPITTGYPTKEKAAELGLTSGPKEASPNEILSKILDTINKDSNPLSDYSAYFEAFEPNEDINSMAKSMNDSSGIYAPTQYVSGKIINFYSYQCQYRISSDLNSTTGGILAKMPTNKGKVYIGPHLPIATSPENKNIQLSATIDSQLRIHKQIGNLTPRYRFPYFNTTEQVSGANAPGISFTGGDYYGSLILQNNVEANIASSIGLFGGISLIELSEFNVNHFSLMPSVDTGGLESLQIDIPLNFTELNSKIEGQFPIEWTYITMPIPETQIAFGLANPSTIANGAYGIEFDSPNYDLKYSEWGIPQTPEDEQFYIAMRWPYMPQGVDQETLDQWTAQYGLDPAGLYGTAADYKERKVMVYNPSNGRAVVCRPAFFLWGSGQAAIMDGFQVNIDSNEASEEGAISAAPYDAMVSPDAAYFLGIITYNPYDVQKVMNAINGIRDGDTDDTEGDIIWTGSGDTDDVDKDPYWAMYKSGYRSGPVPQECYMGWVPDFVPVGVVASSVSPVQTFKEVKSDGSNVASNVNAVPDITIQIMKEDYQTESQTASHIVGFGAFVEASESVNPQNYAEALEALRNRAAGELSAIRNPLMQSGRGETPESSNPFDVMLPYNSSYIDLSGFTQYAGNPVNVGSSKTYFEAVVQGDYGVLTRDELNKLKANEYTLDSEAKRTSFLPVFSPLDAISVQARQYYDEDYDPNMNVIAGDGRNIVDAQQIWDQFRAEYHTLDSVKKIFADIYGLDPDSEDEFPALFQSILTGDRQVDPGIGGIYNGSDGLADEFSILMGSDYVGNLSTEIDIPRRLSTQDSYLEALEFMRKNLVDAPLDKGGLIAYYENIMKTTFSRLKDNFFKGKNVESVLGFSLDADVEGVTSAPNVATILHDNIKTPKQLFLLMVGIFRQRMWEDPYARAWLVLKPDKNSTWNPFGSANGWSFRSIDPIFRAFIDPYQDYAKESKKAKFLKLLVSTKGEGNSSDTVYGEVIEDTGEFLNRTVGPIVTALGGALTGLMSMFKTSMQQLGYALSEVGNFKKQANILNKALNDSIYYSLGRPGSILRAVDNPFTREYGEPVIEIREPFQRLHYISSFSHILSNQIQENINGVATTITAVSDGKYPVTVALDKGAPAERQVEKTIETGIYYDNVVGSGLTGFLHPLFHPLETIRGASKLLQGAPDELSARRIALAHLKESIKDIYGGELLVIGSPDIRPHDLIYLADVYERMYGIFEVEQVIHHFTPELGFITSITPNALVTVNDPARWFQTSWMQSWMHVQNIRNDTRIYLDRARSSSSGISYGGNISIDRLSEVLSPELVGGFQYTHGSSALVKDIIANQTAMDIPGHHQAGLNEAAKQEGGVPTFVLATSWVPLVGGAVWSGWKWVRDNVLDQHGCYVQYLNKNGQPMDAGLSYNQGMVVGQHHSKVLLPGILGARVKARTPEGYGYIRTDDLFKSLGWRESEINDLVRYISYEAALVHSRVLNVAGIGPDKAAFEWKFRVICKVVDVVDGDTIDVMDVISGATFRIRFDGVNAAETNTIGGKIAVPDTNNPNNSLSADIELLDTVTPGGAAKMFVKNALKDRIIIVRINQTRTDGDTGSGGKAIFEDEFEAGSSVNKLANYQLDIFGRTATGEIDDGTTRALGTIMYYYTEEALDKSAVYIANLFREFSMDIDVVKNKVVEDIYAKSPFAIHFSKIYDAIDQTIETEFYTITSPSDMLYDLPEDKAKAFSVLVYFKILEEIYDTASRWPQIEWDEYYPDGYPMTLNWELVTNNLAKVFVKDLQKESQAVQTANESSALPNT